jgi:phosphoribosylanthranilate isomerase
LVLVRAKICGIQSRFDLETAIAAGAGAIGLISGVTHVAEDSLTADEARDLSSRTPPFVSRVLVTHLEDAGEILSLARHVGVDIIQVHGLVTYASLANVFERAEGRRITKAVHVVGPAAIEEAVEFAGACDAIHLDSRTDERLGGTGVTHDWSISRKIADALRTQGQPVILSGGLTPDNVVDAIRAVRPFAVDVNSGVENPAGRKDPDLCAEFVSRSGEALSAPNAEG